MINFGRDLCTELSFSGQREWLVTNGLGGYASGTVAGVLTRRYHGLLIAALHPPVRRTLLLTKLDETADYHGSSYQLFSNRWATGLVKPNGFIYLERFHLEGATPVWTYTLADACLEKRVWMQAVANTTYIRYDLKRAMQPLDLRITALVNYRDHQGTTRACDWQMQIDPVAGGLRLARAGEQIPFYLLCKQGKISLDNSWNEDFYLSCEADRGFEIESLPGRITRYPTCATRYTARHPIGTTRSQPGQPGF